jgi:hypothetical protein
MQKYLSHPVRVVGDRLIVEATDENAEEKPEEDTLYIKHLLLRQPTTVAGLKSRISKMKKIQICKEATRKIRYEGKDYIIHDCLMHPFLKFSVGVDRVNGLHIIVYTNNSDSWIVANRFGEMLHENYNSRQFQLKEN